MSRLKSLFESTCARLHHSRHEQECELNVGHHAGLVDSDSETDSSSLAEAREGTLGHDTGQEEVEARAEEEATNCALPDGSFHIPVLSEHVEK